MEPVLKYLSFVAPWPPEESGKILLGHAWVGPAGHWERIGGQEGMGKGAIAR